MNSRFWRVLTVAVLVGVRAGALEWQELAAAKRLREDKRFDEAVARLQAVAGRAATDGEQFHYLQQAIDIAVDSLKDFDKALALVDEVRDPARRDYARLQVLWRFRKVDEALAVAEGKSIDDWPAECRGNAHHIMADIRRQRGDEAAAIGHYEKAARAPATPTAVRGGAARQAGVMYLARGDRARAEAMFREALAITPAAYAWRCESLLTLSGMLIQDGRAAEAAALFDAIDFEKMEGGQWKSRLLEGQARALLAAGKRIRAIETFDRLLQSGISREWQAKIEKELDKLADEM